MSLLQIFKNVKDASNQISKSSIETRQNILKSISHLLDTERENIKNSNLQDINYAANIGLSASMIDRLRITDKVIDLMIDGVLDINNQEEVIGIVESGVTRPNGLKINKIRVPLGVVGMIYESRPNVTVDSAALCIKSGNAVILRGGKEAINSNKILADIIRKALKENQLSEDIVYLIQDSDRNLIAEMAQAKGYIDVIIPRGGSGLINFVVDNAKIPVIMHDKGVCHTYIDKYANIEMAKQIAFNGKVHRPSACNATETLLIHKDIAESVLPDLSVMFNDVGVDLRCDEVSIKYMDARPAIEEDFGVEFNDMILSVKVVDSVDEAINHIYKYGSNHSESIVTENYTNAQKFLDEVDAAAVYVNASTRFTDGGEFGLGAEIGISTQKLHVRGPMGAKDLTTTKYQIYGTGQLRK